MAGKHYRGKFIVRDERGRIWGRGDTTGTLTGVMCQGRTLWEWVGDGYVERDSPRLHLAAISPADNFMQPAPRYKGEWIVLTRDGRSIAHGLTFDEVKRSAIGRRDRAVWKWVEGRYVRHESDELIGVNESIVICNNYPYMRPVVQRDTWLVTAASGRVWARGEQVENIVVAASAGRRRAVWQWVGNSYTLRAVDGVWFNDEVKS